MYVVSSLKVTMWRDEDQRKSIFVVLKPLCRSQDRNKRREGRKEGKKEGRKEGSC